MNLPFILEGIVIRGKSRGKALGFPTANIKIDKKLPEGIYISKTKVLNKNYQSITFIGTAETFTEKEFSVETYILDFDQDFYGEKISVELLKKLRDNKKFDSVEELVEQMKVDEKETRYYFRS